MMATGNNGHRILVIGAGYAGMMTALRAAGRTRRAGGAVTLINQTDQFVERIRLHQLAAGQALPQRSIPHMLRGAGAGFLQGRVIAVDAVRREVVCDTAEGIRPVGYDSLVYALGSTIDTETVPGVAEYAHTLSGPVAAGRLHAALLHAATRRGRLAVCGGGLTGIEAAAELAEAHPNVQVALVTRDTVGVTLSRRGQTYLRRVFDRLGVQLVEQATVRRLHGQCLEFDGRSPLPFDLCLWAGSFRAPSLAREAGIEVNDRGQVIVDRYLRARSHPDILAVGDAALPVEPCGAPPRMACATAMPMGAHAADVITAELRGEQPHPFRFVYQGLGVSLGRRTALGQNLRDDDTPRELIITGRAGAWTKEFFSRYTVLALKAERRLPGAYRWPHGQDTLAQVPTAADAHPARS